MTSSMGLGACFFGSYDLKFSLFLICQWVDVGQELWEAHLLSSRAGSCMF